MGLVLEPSERERMNEWMALSILAGHSHSLTQNPKLSERWHDIKSGKFHILKVLHVQNHLKCCIRFPPGSVCNVYETSVNCMLGLGVHSQGNSLCACRYSRIWTNPKPKNTFDSVSDKRCVTSTFILASRLPGTGGEKGGRYLYFKAPRPVVIGCDSPSRPVETQSLILSRQWRGSLSEWLQFLSRKWENWVNRVTFLACCSACS